MSRAASGVLFFLVAAGALAAPAPAPATHPFSVHDMVAMQRIGEPQLSPDGRRIVFVLRTTDLEGNRGRHDLWIVGTDGTGLRQLTSHEAGDTSPVWAPDGRSVWFLSTRSGASQVWRLAVDGGEARQVTHLPLDVTSFRIAPDGAHLVLSIEVFPDCVDLACTRARLDEQAARKSSARVWERLMVRHWDAWKDGRRSHLWVLPVGESDTAREGGAVQAVDVMSGMDADCPPKPFGGSEEYAFTPDGHGLVFSARDAGVEEAWSTDFDLYLAPLDGSAAPRNLTEANPAWDGRPLFSPDGKTLAWLAMREPGYESDRFRIVRRPWPDGEPRVLTEAWDRSPADFAWARDGRTLLVSAANLGQQTLFAVGASSGQARPIVEQGTVRWFADAGERLVYALDHLRSPTELYSARGDGKEPRRLTRVNDDRMAATRTGEPEAFRFAGWNDETVHGWIVKPADFSPGRRYPVALLIHGGPQGSFGNEFHYRWNPQAYAGAGYAVVTIDFHGSVGYGQAFTDSIRGDWGGKPLVDLQRGLAAALARSPWMDGERVCALGASYGGYMVNWIAGNWPDRFRCLVSHDGNLDERAAYFNTEELWFPEHEHEGTPWDNPEGYEKHNPLRFIQHWQTPMLVIHGALDYRVVDVQGLATFTALQRRGIPSKLVWFPDENHWVLKPHNSIFWHETVLEWLDQWTAEP
jgi:dipeptidyl aminopeptidase/acylaminoacyl peptidase